MFRNCPLRVENECVEVDLFPFEMNDFDLIVGMDWLGKISCGNGIALRQLRCLVECSMRNIKG